MILEKIALQLLSARMKSMDRFEREPEKVQSEQLKYLIHRAKDTEWGQKYRYREIKDYRQFAARVPVSEYEQMEPWIGRMFGGEKNILWPGEVNWFARSSGTTNDRSKLIPVTTDSLHKCHYRGGQDALAAYLKNVPQSKLFSGKGLVLGGSHKPEQQGKKVKTGDLSAILIQNIHPLAEFYRIPSRKIALMDEWEAKMELICRHTAEQNVTSLSGVPSWMLVFIKKILENTGKHSLTEIWPNLEVFFHGGISFTPYEQQYQALIPSPRMRYLETYNASEGFFAVQDDLHDRSMQLLLDYGVFFEFIPVEDLYSEDPLPCPIQAVEAGKNYAPVISASNGLWRYKIGDTVRFTSVYPHKILITGRTRSFINAFGEELMVDNAERAIHQACLATGSLVREYTVGPVYISLSGKGRHQWLIEFAIPPDSLPDFAQKLDLALQELNSDYAAKRYRDLTLDLPEITIARPNLFYDWLESKGRLGGQHKVPRLSNNRDVLDSLLLAF